MEMQCRKCGWCRFNQFIYCDICRQMRLVDEKRTYQINGMERDIC